MKLGSLKDGGRDGTLIVVSRDLARGVRVAEIAPTLQAALESWAEIAPRLATVSDALNAASVDDAFALETAALASPLPRAYQWADGSAYLNHVELV
ncbi:MAG: FAA hydrolase family protein, partial [Alphaproteobacteria bacterium]